MAVAPLVAHMAVLVAPTITMVVVHDVHFATRGMTMVMVNHARRLAVVDVVYPARLAMMVVVDVAAVVVATMMAATVVIGCDVGTCRSADHRTYHGPVLSAESIADHRADQPAQGAAQGCVATIIRECRRRHAGQQTRHQDCARLLHDTCSG